MTDIPGRLSPDGRTWTADDTPDELIERMDAGVRPDQIVPPVPSARRPEPVPKPRRRDQPPALIGGTE